MKTAYTIFALLIYVILKINTTMRKLFTILLCSWNVNVKFIARNIRCLLIIFLIVIWNTSCHYRVPITKKNYNSYVEKQYTYKAIEKKIK